MSSVRMIVLCLCFVVGNAAIAPLRTVREPVPGKYIVVLQEDVDVDNFISSLDVIKHTDIGANVKHKFSQVLNGFSVNINEDRAKWLCQIAGVKYVEEASIVRPMRVASWGLDRIDQRDVALDGIYAPTNDGTGVNVYVIDTGINFNHNDFGGRAQPFWTGQYDHEDCNGHGSHCAGTVGGNLYGVAKNVNLFSSRVFPCSGGVSVDVIIAAMDYIAANGVLPAVVSMSLGGSGSAAEDESALALIAQGFSVITSAGNDNADACNYSPARVPEVISVGSTDKTDTRSGFSNWGQCVDIFAPGSEITSCWYTGDFSQKTISGTSMACPHVSGAVAKYFQRNPANNPAQAFAQILTDATPDKVNNHKSPTNLLLYSK